MSDNALSVGRACARRWGKMTTQVTWAHLGHSASVGDIARASGIILGLSAWGRRHGIIINGAGDDLEQIQSGQGKIVADRWVTDYDKEMQVMRREETAE